MRRAILSVTGPKQDGEREFDNLILTRLVTHIENRLTTIVRWAAAVAVLIVVATATFAAVSIYQDVQRGHDQCIASNNARAEIKGAFEGLYDSFIASSGGSQPALDFKKANMAKLDKALPQRDC